VRKFSLALMVIELILLNSCVSQAGNGSPTTQPISIKNIANSGSDTIVNLALAWAEEYHSLHPDVQISVTGSGSGTGITALINGTVDIANASRRMKPEEMEKAKEEGFTPQEFVIAKDGIGVIVNPNNPVNHITIEQLSMIYKGEITNWKEVGGENRPIVAVSRESNSGTHVYFLETVVRLGNSGDKSIFAATILLLPSSEGIIAEVRDNPNAIGYDGLGYITKEVKTLAVAKDAAGKYVLPSAETVNDKTYPISRDLYMYTRGIPQGVLLDYLIWCLSAEGQKIVKQLGFVPLH